MNIQPGDEIGLSFAFACGFVLFATALIVVFNVGRAILLWNSGPVIKSKNQFIRQMAKICILFAFGFQYMVIIDEPNAITLTRKTTDFILSFIPLFAILIASHQIWRHPSNKD